MNHECIRLHNAAVIRSGKPILEVDSLEISSGSFFGVVGPNGAGKTTFLSLCAVLISPDRGDVMIFGRKVDDLTPWQQSRLRCRIALVPQSAAVNPIVPLTVEEVISMGVSGSLGLMKRFRAQQRDLVAYWIDNFKLGELRRRTYRSLSGGEQRKVLIARAMAQQPDLLLLDEPTANLDLDWKERLLEIIEQIHCNLRLTVVMISHEVNQLPKSCDTVGLLKQGRLVFAGDRAQALSDEKLSELYQCPVKTVCFDNRHFVLRAKRDP